MIQQLPTPPFNRDSALAKVQAAEDAWNSRIPGRVVGALSPVCVWRSRQDVFQGRPAIEYFLRNRWAVETHNRMMKELLAFTDTRMSVRFECEWLHPKKEQWYRSHGNEHWEFDLDGYMTRRDMSANNIPIASHERRIGSETNKRK